MKNSKNLILTVLLCVFAFTVTLEAQYGKPTRIFKKGQVDVQIGVGLTGTFIADKAKMLTPPLFASLEGMISKNVSIGGFIEHSVSEGERRLYLDGIPGQWRNTYTVAGLRIAGHYTERDNWDFYGGLSLGARHSIIEDMLPDLETLNMHLGIEPESTSFAMSGFVGAKYAFKEKFTAFGEIGVGAALLKVGVGYRLF